MQRTLCSKPEEDTCAVCTNNAHRWILLYCSAGNAAIPRPVLQRSGRFFSDCRSPLPLFPNQYLLDLCIDCAIDVAPLNFTFRCTRLDVPTFPPTVLTLTNVFSPSRHRCFLLLFSPSSDPLFSPSSFTAGIIIQNWTKSKNNPTFAMFFQGQM